MKRTFDFILSGMALVILLPLLVAVSMLILITDGRPVFYRQERIGHRGIRFKMWKFRSMVRDAESLGAPLTVGQDPRITRIGHFLRRTKLDELPQLWNVLVGEMSFVGPRPEVEKYVRRYTTAQSRVLELVPGITDVASIAYRSESKLLACFEDPEREYVEHIIPEKIRLNLEYAARANVFRDCLVIMQTAGRLCCRR